MEYEFVLEVRIRTRLPNIHKGIVFFCPRANLPGFFLLVICFGGSHGQIAGKKKELQAIPPDKKKCLETINHTLFNPLPTAIIHTTAAPPTNCLLPPLSAAVRRRPPLSAGVRCRPLPSLS
jgi:hypothetical protein